MNDSVGRESLPTLTIDGQRFSDLSGFYAEVSKYLIPGTLRVSNLDSFNDILRGGFGTPERRIHPHPARRKRSKVDSWTRR